jgi:hypothetical protein
VIPVQSLLNSLQAWAQEELAGQRRMLTLIERQERALCANDPAGLSEATQALEPELAAQSERAEKRRRIFAVLAGHWQADPGALSLGSILARSGEQPGLVRLRDELRRSTSELLRRNRRFSALAAAHRRLVEELVGALLSAGNPAPRGNGGALVDAEA